MPKNVEKRKSGMFPEPAIEYLHQYQKHLYYVRKKECPSCAMEIDNEANVCPICGYEFPGASLPLKWIALILAIIVLLFFLLV